jgi:hypothetical protein
MNNEYLLSAIQALAVWSMNRDDMEEVREALELIESICRHNAPVWSPEEEAKYGLAELDESP